MRSWLTSTLLVLLLALTPDLAAQAQSEAERAPLTLVVNGVEKGTAIVYLRPGDVLIQVEDLEQVGLRNFAGRRETIAGETYVSLASLAPGITYELDEKALALRLTVPPAAFPETTLELRQARPPGIEYAKNSSAFLNYSLTAQDLERVSLSGESGLSFDGALLFNSFTRDVQGRFVRGFTNLTLDNRERLRRWVIGDSFAGTGGLGGSALLGGVSVSRNYGLDPYFVRYPTLTYTGAALSATTVEIYINDTLVRREQLPPGPFELRNLPVVAGQGTARIVLRDAFGRQEEVVLPVYFAPRLLAKGLSEYSYHLGLRRNQTGTRSWDYGPLAFLGQHRYGVTDSATAGFRVEATRNLVNAGPTIQARLPFGELEVAAAASHSRGTGGAAASLAYTYLSRRASFSAFVRLLSSRYAHLSLEPAGDRPRLQANASASLPLHPRASLTLQYAFTDSRDRPESHRVSFLSNLRVFRRATLLLSGSRTHEIGRSASHEAFLGVSYYLGKNTTANVSHRNVDGRGTTTFEVQKSLPVGEGFGFRVREETGTQERFSGLFQYNAPFGRYEAQLDRSAGRTSTTLRVSGGIVGIGGRMYFTRPVQDAFALIRVPGVPRVQGYFSNQKIGRTNARGDLLIPNMLSYYGNQLRIAEQDVPINHSIQATEKVIAPPFRGGALVLFPVQRIQSLMGTVVVEIAGKPVIPAYGQLTVTANGRQIESPLGKQGEFYLENVPTGRHAALVEYEDGTCKFELNVPASEKPEVELGTVRCIVLSDPPAAQGQAMNR